jgi:hypothetical protein
VIRKCCPVAFALLIAVAVPAAAQDFVVDLGQHDPGKTDQIAVPAGTTGAVRITSRLPARQYTVTTRIRVIPVAPLVKPGSGAEALGTDLCVQADTAKLVERALGALQSEKDIDPKIEQFRKDAAACPTDPGGVLAIVNAQVRRLTTQELRQVTIRAGEELEVRVLRDDNQLWTVVFSGGPRGTWHTLYGFMFTPNFDKAYFSVPEGSQFRITEQFTSKADLNFIPSVFWSWMPASRENKTLNSSWTAGLGFDQAKPAVFGGGSFSVNHNIALVLGVVAQRQKRLNTNYDPKKLPLVPASLTPEQLSREAFRANVFLGIAFRFGTSPFGEPKKEEPKTEEPKKEEPNKTEKKGGL